ncbi:MAG: hypothetical protein J6Z08_02745 [Elusimicrobiales bacterium]|nr:hypothetical protein [Elusimicrobiales bacterium]
MYTVSGIAVFFIMLMVIFIAWQFKMLKKYALSYDKFKIHPTEGYISVNGQRIYFSGIEYITVKELQQPSAAEQFFSKSAFYSYMSEIVFHLKGQAPLYCTFNSKGTLYNALKQLQPYVRIDENIENYKPTINWKFLILIIISIIIGYTAGKR